MSSSISPAANLRLGRRGFLLGAAALGGATLFGCASSTSAGAASLRFTWWGSDYLNKTTQQTIDVFTAKNPGTSVTPEPGEWSSYWDRLATSTAANDAPDVINMDQKYIAEYGGRGALMNLKDVEGLDLNTIDQQALASGTYEDQLFGISTGQNAYSIVANKDLFDEAEVDLPDDKTWTWDDYRDIAAKISEASKGKVLGTAYGINEASLVIWLRQRDQQLYTGDGKLGYETAALVEFFDYYSSLLASGGGPSASQAAEENGLTVEQAAFGTRKAAMSWYWTNQLGALANASGSTLIQLRSPSQNGDESKNGMFYKPSQFWSLSSRTKNKDGAIAFLDFLINDNEAAKILAVDRGAPVNSATRAAIESVLKPVDQQALDFLDSLAPAMADAPPVPPVGSSDVQNVLVRIALDVLFERTTSAKAADQFTTELKGMIDTA